MENSSQNFEKEQQFKPDKYNATEPDVTPRREGGDDAIAEASPLDSNADEIIFANQQKDNSLSQLPNDKGKVDK